MENDKDKTKEVEALNMLANAYMIFLQSLTEDMTEEEREQFDNERLRLKESGL